MEVKLTVGEFVALSGLLISVGAFVAWARQQGQRLDRLSERIGKIDEWARKMAMRSLVNTPSNLTPVPMPVVNSPDDTPTDR